MTFDDFGDEWNVSRETFERLERFANLLQKWNPRINLVSKSTLPDLWSRHIVDSIQVFQCVEANGHWVDLGSGGGFPGIIIGILGAELNNDLRVTLVESDQRKSAFLRTAARETGIPVSVVSKRIEQIGPLNADILSARALADLSKLMEYSDLHLVKNGTAVFPKGATWKKEVDKAREHWSFSAAPVKSVTNSDAVILKIKGIMRG